MDAVELINISKSFGPIQAVSDCSFNVGSGEVLSLLGPSGCGKTTILRMIAGFEVPTSGRILIAGQDMVGRRPYERNIGIVFQDYALFPHLTVEQNVGYGLRYHGAPSAEAHARVSEMLQLVQLEHLRARRPGQLSGGQQQRVALARALATRPDVVLLDEPLSALDAKLRLELRAELKEVLARVRAAVIVVTHDQEEAMSLGDRVVVMNAGRLEQIGAPMAVYAAPATRFVAEFVGRSNWFSGTLSDATGGKASIVCAEGISVAAGTRGLTTGTQHEICIRPERLAVHREPPATAPGRVAFAARVIESMHLGPDLSIVAMMPSGKRLLVIEKNVGQFLIPPGTDVILSFDAADAIVIPSAPTAAS